MLGNQSVRNEKPQDLARTKPQGSIKRNGYSNSTPMLKDSKSRYEKGMELYKSGKVSIGSKGFFKVSGFQVDTEKMQWECPDYKTRKEACKHLFAAVLFVKNRGNATIEHLNGRSNGVKSEFKQTSHKPKETHNKDFDRQSIITRVALLNSATEILKTHNWRINFDDLLALAGKLEAWAMGQQNQIILWGPLSRL